ncbi:MAG: hypothetical protein V4619_12090 [Bacteroidota bacterium]
MDILDKNLIMEDRFVAFIDILGFKDYIITYEKNNDYDLLHKIKSILNFMQEETEESHYWSDLPVYELRDGKMYEYELGHPKMTYVSDCIIISADGDMDGFKGLSQKIHKIITELAVDGIFCRGAISKGKLFHHDKILFGTAYMKAYQLEVKAVYPRVIIDPEILDFFNLTQDKVPLAPIFYGKDDDEFYYLKYFTWNYFPPYMHNWIHYLLVVRQHIVKKLLELEKLLLERSDENTSKVYEKYKWLVLEFNRTLDFYREDLDERLERENKELEVLHQKAMTKYNVFDTLEKYGRQICKIEKNELDAWV